MCKHPFFYTYENEFGQGVITCTLCDEEFGFEDDGDEEGVKQRGDFTES